MTHRGFAFLAFSVFLFATMPAAAQRKLPDSVQQPPKPVQKAPERAQEPPKPAADRFQSFRYRMAYSASSAHVAGFQEVVVKSGGSGAPAQAPKRVTGMNKNADITLKRGVVQGDSSFAQWVGRAKEPQHPRNVVIDTFDEAGHKSSSMHLGGCVVAAYQGMPDLDAQANSVRIEVMTLHCTTMKRASQ